MGWEAQYANPGGWGQILAYMAFCEVSQEQTPGSAAYAGDFGFKVLTASDPAEKTKKLNAEIANGRLAMMAIIGMFFQAGIGVLCAYCLLQLYKKRNTTKSVAERVQQCRASAQQINIGEEKNTILCQLAWRVLSLWRLFLASHVFSTPHVWLFDIVLTVTIYTYACQ